MNKKNKIFRPDQWGKDERGSNLMTKIQAQSTEIEKRTKEFKGNREFVCLGCEYIHLLNIDTHKYKIKL